MCVRSIIWIKGTSWKRVARNKWWNIYFRRRLNCEHHQSLVELQPTMWLLSSEKDGEWNWHLNLHSISENLHMNMKKWLRLTRNYKWEIIWNSFLSVKSSNRVSSSPFQLYIRYAFCVTLHEYTRTLWVINIFCHSASRRWPAIPHWERLSPFWKWTFRPRCAVMCVCGNSIFRFRGTMNKFIQMRHGIIIYRVVAVTSTTNPITMEK